MKAKNYTAQLLFVYVLLLAWMVFGCNPAKKIERAEQRVMLNPVSFNKLGAKWATLNPCLNDSSTVLKKGGTDTMKLGDLFGTFGTLGIYRGPFPPAFYKPWFDTTYSVDPIYKETPKDTCDPFSYGNGFSDGVDYILSQRVPVKRPDTLQTSTKDGRQTKLDTDSLNQLRADKAALGATITELGKQLKKAEQKATGWLWWFIAAVALLVASNVTWLFLKIKNPLS